MVTYAGPKNRQYQSVFRITEVQAGLGNQTDGYGSNQFDIVYDAGTFWKLSDAHLPATVPQRGIGINAIASNVSGVVFPVIMFGLVSNSGWSFTSGNRVFLMSGGGAGMTAPIVSGDRSIVLGIALTTQSMMFMPDDPVTINT